VWAPGYRRGDRAQKRVHRKEKGRFQVTKFANHYVNYIAILIAAAAWCIGDAATSQPVPGPDTAPSRPAKINRDWAAACKANSSI
jgi:hypothetical protein